MSIECDHPRPALNLPGYVPPRLAWQVPSYIPDLPPSAARVIRDALSGVYQELTRLGQTRNLIPLQESLEVRPGSVVSGVGDGQTITLLPPGAEGYLDPVTVLLTDVENPVTVLHPDGTVTTLGEPGAYEFLPAGDNAFETSPGGLILGGGIPTDRLLGRDSPGTGAVQFIALTAPLEFDGSQNIRIAADGISNTLLRNSGALSVIGRSANSTGNPADISATAASGGVLRESGNVLGFGAITLAAFPSIATDTVLANVTSSTAQPTAVALSSLANNSLAWDSTSNRFDYIGSTSVINITPSGAQGVVNISTLLCGGAVTVQPTAHFDIDGFTAMPTGFWFDLIYRDTSAFRGTLNENTGATTTSIRNAGATALAFTTQEAVRLKYYNTRWRVVGVSSRPLASLFPGAPIYDVMASPFNAVADGTTDDTAAINAAIVAANAAPGIIYLGDNHRITAGLTPITSDGVVVRGRGRWQNASVIRVDAVAAPTAVFTFDNVNFGGVEDVWIRGVGALYTSGSAVLFESCGGCRALRLYISQLYNGVDIFECIQTDVELVTFDDLYGEFAVRAYGNGNSCHTTFISRCYGQNDLAAAQVGSVTAWQAGTAYVVGNAVTSNGQIYQATVAGTSGGTPLSGVPGATTATAHTATIADGSVTWVWSGGNITWYLQDSYSTTFRLSDCAAVGGGYGLVVQDTFGDTPQFTRVNNLECDHCASGGVKLDGGRQAEFQQLFVTSVLNGIGVEVTANQEGDWLFRSGYVFGVPFEGFVIAQDQGEISDFTICACGTRTANTYDAVRIDANTSHWNIADCTIGFAHSQAAQTRYGISIASGCDNYLVVGNRLIGHDTGAILNTPGVSTTRVVRSNIPETTTGAIPDGDYGDITVTVGGTVWNIDPNVVGDAEIRQSAGFSVIGRAGSTTGNVADITATAASQLLKLNNTGTALLFGQAATASIEDDAVTNPKLANMATARLKGRTTTGTGDPEDLTLSSGDSTAWNTATGGTISVNYTGTTSVINITPTGAQGTVDISTLVCGGAVTVQPSGAFDIDGFTVKATGFWFDLIYRDTTTHVGTLNENIGGAANTGIRNPGNASMTFTTQESVRLKYYNNRWRIVSRSTRSVVLTDGDKGDVTVSASGATWTIDNDVVTDAKLRNSAALSVIGRSANSTGDPADIAAASAGHVLRRGDSSNTLVFATVSTLGLEDNAVTNAKLADMAQATIKGRAAGAGTGDPTDLTAAQVATILASLFTAILEVHYGDAADASISITPPAGATWFEIEFQGAGAGGGGADADSIKESCAGGGGGAGAWKRHRRTITSGNITGAIGAGGTAGSDTGGNGGAGGLTSYSYDGTGDSAAGGSGGSGSSGGPTANAQLVFAVGGTGGLAAGSSLEQCEGGAGHPGMMFSVSANDNAACGGNGGASRMGGGGKGGVANADATSQPGLSGQAPGSGGGGAARVSTGAASTGEPGGVGEDGYMRVTFYSGPVPTNAAIT